MREAPDPPQIAAVDEPSAPADVSPEPRPSVAIVGTIPGGPFRPGFDPRRNTIPPAPHSKGGRDRSKVRELARQAFRKVRPFAILMDIARKAPKERDRIEALKMLAMLGYSQTLFVGNQQAGGGALPPGDAPEEDAVQFYLPANTREREEESA